ncbi:MAG: hypothetical protein ACOCYP_10475 [Planctomycetota bacterium]
MAADKHEFRGEDRAGQNGVATHALRDIERPCATDLGWTCCGGVTHSLMIDCRANDLRHMPIFRWAAGCVVTGGSFTGDTSLALRCHGRFPHDILVDDNVFDTPRPTVGIDGTHTLRHGLAGPRFVMHHSRVQGGRGLFDIRGGVEGHGAGAARTPRGTVAGGARAASCSRGGSLCAGRSLPRYAPIPSPWRSAHDHERL